jgi:hypothetical protein
MQVIVVDADRSTPNPFTFVNNILDKFDLDISRFAIYAGTFYCR